MLLGKIWYFFYFGGLVCVWPYLNLLYRANGLNDAQIGVLAAIKPWVSAPSSFAWSGLADRCSAHRAIMIATFIVSTLTRTSVSVCHTFSAFLVLAVLGECLAAPVGVMADAAVVAACKRDTDYGKSRLWGAVAWGSLSAFSGAMVSRFGMPAGFMAYVLLSVPCVYCAWHMEFKLGAQHHQQQQQQQQQLQGTDNKPWQVNQQQQQLQQLDDDSCHNDVEQQHLLVQLQHSTAGVPCKDGVNNSNRNSSSRPGQTVQADTDQLNDAEVHQPVVVQPVQQQQQHESQGTQLLLHKHQLTLQQRPHSQQQQQQQALQIQSSGSVQEDATCVLLLDSTHSPDFPQPRRQQGQQQQKLGDEKEDCSRDIVSSSTTPVSGSRSSTAIQLPAKQQGDPSQQQQHHQDNHRQPVGFWQGLKQLLSRPAVVIFMWQATVMGFGIGVIGEFLFLFLQELGGSETLMGLTLTVTCIAEVPVFHFQDKILRHISVHSMLHVVLWTYALRLGLYALLPRMGSAWAVLPIELLHGITFGCGWSAGTITSKRVAPPELAATMQGIFQGLYFGVGQGMGALIGGLLKRRFGGQAMFAMCAGIVLAGWVVGVVAELATARLSSTAHAAASGDGNITEEQQQQQQGHQLQGIVSAGMPSWLHRLRAAVSRALSRRESSSADDASSGTSSSSSTSSAAARRQLKHKYGELASKDSGPDLVLALADTSAFGDRLVARAAV